MKTAPRGKYKDSLVFTHHGKVCTVRRSHRRHHDVALKRRASVLERLFLPLLPRMSLGEIV
jgi:hypothetical protein